MLFLFKRKKHPAVVKMIMPGRRALGEQWVEVTVRPKEDGNFSIEKQPVQAPPQARPVVIPAMANLSDEEVNFILGAALKAQDYYSHQKRRRPTPAEEQRIVTQWWQDYCEQKLRFFKGQTNIGAGGIFQRQAPGVKDWN